MNWEPPECYFVLYIHEQMTEGIVIEMNVRGESGQTEFVATMDDRVSYVALWQAVLGFDLINFVRGIWPF